MQDLSWLLADVSAEAVAGENLEFDPDFGALERATQGKGEQQFGDTVMPAEAPDWLDAETQALALLRRTRDLRILGYLALARLQLYGMRGFASVLAVTHGLLQMMWVPIHPQLDPEDDNDPTLRANALLRLGEPGRVLRVLRDLPLASSPRAGRISWRDIGYATGALELPEGREKPLESIIRGAFQETDAAKLADLRQDLATSIADVVGIGAAFDANAGYGNGPDLGDLLKLLRELQKHVERYAPVVTEAEEVTMEEPPLDTPAGASPGSPSGAASSREAGGAPVTSLKSISNREDALRLLDLVRAYYARYEPSSPLLFLLDRARRLADKDFFAILRDIAPDGLSQAELVAGAREE